MQTFDLVVTHSSLGPVRTGNVWRGSGQRKLLVMASLAALAAGGVAWIERPPTLSATSERPKLDARISIAPERPPSDDDVRLAAFQQSVARSFVDAAPAVVDDANAHPAAAGAKPTHPRNRAVVILAKRDDPAATPVPPPRPSAPVAMAPMVIEADLPAVAPPIVQQSFADASLQAMGEVGRRIALAPVRARDFAATTVERMRGTLSDAWANIGL